MKIGAVSKKLGIPASTIRYYESEGLIHRQARVSGVREFDATTITTLRFVQLAQQAGFSISEMKSLLLNYNQNLNVTSIWGVLAQEKRISIQNQIKDLQHMDNILEKLLVCDCCTLNECVTAAFKLSEENRH